MAVKKALVAVSRCLQDSAPVDKTRMVGSRPLEAVSRETLPDLHVEQLSQKNSLLPTFPSSSIPMPSSSISYISGVRPLSLESERVSTLDAKNQQQEVVFKILCPNDRVGGVIGKGGAIVRALQNETGAIISVGATSAESEERLITITASEVCHLQISNFSQHPFFMQVCLFVMCFPLSPSLCRALNHGTPLHKKLRFLSILGL